MKLHKSTAFETLTVVIKLAAVLESFEIPRNPTIP